MKAIVSANFYSPSTLKRLGWDSGHLSESVRAEPSEEGQVRALLAVLGSSHTAHYTRDDPGYWQLLSIFEPNLDSICTDPARLPTRPIRYEGIGVSWVQAADRWFVGGAFPDGPAERAGLLLGDEVVRADKEPFAPVGSFRGRAGEKVDLKVRRSATGPLIDVPVIPRWSRPQADFQEATAKSARVISAGGHRIGYLRIWSWAGEEMQATVLDAIVDLNTKQLDSWIVDLRGGWGGANPEFAAVFSQDIAALRTVDRQGKEYRRDTQLRGKGVLLIDGGTRSGKEIIAYSLQKSKRATLVGERTAGAVLAGRPFCLSDGSLLYLATADVSVDGERLEGHGVRPDVQQSFGIPYAAGADPQLAKAIEVVVGAR